ncbi:GP60 [Burkholderia pseudomallei]|nr:GP60 [Burkholderia pseudomallei]CAJ5392803.1 GP60 [Burkholderia pseudomallei]CAJ7342668.1 GP60 [Burkholderia pseudomallei]
MSIKLTNMVWKHFEGGGSAMIVMLALADWCNDDGLSLHPSIRAIAKKCHLSECRARRIVHHLIDEGFLEVIGNEFGGDPGKSREYRFRLDRFGTNGGVTPSADATPSPDATPGADARYPCHPRQGSPSAGDSLDVMYTSIDTKGSGKPDAAPSSAIASTKSSNPPVPETKPRAKVASRTLPTIALTTFLESCRSSGEQPIPEGDTIFDYAEKTGIPRDILWLHWQEFKVRYSEEGAKRYKDWRAVYRRSVRGNWFKLWWINGCGLCTLTTVGEQAKRAHARESA